jgi:phenylacetic acid degradation operon negative regulatory protein
LDALSQRTRMTAEWLLLIRRDPRLPPAPLPPEWPGVRAQEMFRTLQAELIGPADELAAAWLATIADAGAQHPSANV